MNNTDTDNRALDQAHAQMTSIHQMVAALEVDYDRLNELREERDSVGTDDAEALAELEAAADGCESREDAEQRIREDALSVEVRSDWHTPGDDAESIEFRILLCTGGPAVRIRGELGCYGEPSRAWLEYQDWGIPWTERENQDGDHDALLAYANCVYFGERFNQR